MNVPKKQRKRMRDKIQSWTSVLAQDQRLLLDDLDERDKEIEGLKADVADEMSEVANWCEALRSLRDSWGPLYDEKQRLMKRVEELERAGKAFTPGLADDGEDHGY